MEKILLKGKSALHKEISGCVEFIFHQKLGLTVPRLLDYISDMLVRFIHVKKIWELRDTTGKRLQEVADMIAEARQRQGNPRAKAYRHIGDVTLFWAGFFPDATFQAKKKSRIDQLIWVAQGKAAYRYASCQLQHKDEQKSIILLSLSHQFELCAHGLNLVRRQFS